MTALRPAPAAGAHRNLNAALANALVRVHRSYVGRGPTRAQAFYRGDVVVLVLRDVLTKGERSLATSGRPEAARAIRSTFHRAMRPDLVRAVEALTGCRVTAFLCDSHVDPEVTTQLFVLDRPIPGQHPEPRRGGAFMDASTGP
jgi:uncharacterized protein YbcI